MKSRLFVLIILTLLSFMTVSGQIGTKKTTPVGTWKFDAPYAPEGFTTGTIIVGFTEKKYNTTMAFTGNDYKIPGDNVKAGNDSVLFSVYVEGQDVKVQLKIEDDSKMTGKAVYSEGEVPLTLTRDNAAKEIKK